MAEKKFFLKKAGDNRVLIWPVEIPVPVDGGQTEIQTMRARFELLPREVIAELVDEDRKEALGLPIARELSAAEKALAGKGNALLRRVFKGVVDFCEEDGGPPMSDAEAVPLLLDTPYVVQALSNAYWAMVGGRAAKNS